jgi:hypothetical protein
MSLRSQKLHRSISSGMTVPILKSLWVSEISGIMEQGIQSGILDACSVRN